MNMALLNWGDLNSTFAHLLSFNGANHGTESATRSKDQERSREEEGMMSRSSSSSSSSSMKVTKSGDGDGCEVFQMPLHYPSYKKADYETMEEWKLDRLLEEYGLGHIKGGCVEEKRKFAMGAFLWE